MRILLSFFGLVALVALPALYFPTPASADEPVAAAGRCMTCHKEQSPGLYRQWKTSRHGAVGITCIDCHRAQESDADAFEHEGALIATLVTPRDCGACHPVQTEQAAASYHAKAGEILDSKDAYLAHVPGGEPAAVAGCESCHGARVQVDPTTSNHLAELSWPNSGIGRINPDGSQGSCTACHTRHAFSLVLARSPEACSKCHLGPDHPQKEVYLESKHGMVFTSLRSRMNLESDRWVVGEDYAAAPTCATCHMSASPAQALTHDVGERISWTLRPPVSAHKSDWERKRRNMQQVCVACHSQTFVDGHYRQFDGVVNLYDTKFGRPATELMSLVRERGLLENPAAFSNDLEWIYWELWHHEGRRARHGASMAGPDYTWWHGIYDVAHNFYFEFVPALRELEDPQVDARLDALLDDDPLHAWMSRPTAEIKADIRAGKLQELYREMYDPAREE